MNFSAVVRDTNISAVHSLKDGGVKEAFELWNQTLHQLRSNLVEDDEAISDIKVCEHRFIQATDMTGTKGSTYNLYDGDFAFYDKVFLIDDLRREMYNLPSSLQVMIATATILYNMAATSHLNGLLTGKSAYLKRALKLYSLSYTVVKDEAVNIAPAIKLLILAILNNVGHIHSQFLNAEGIRQSQQHLGAALSSMDYSLLNDDEIDFFHVNVLIFQNREVLKNAPAA